MCQPASVIQQKEGELGLADGCQLKLTRGWQGRGRSKEGREEAGWGAPMQGVDGGVGCGLGGWKGTEGGEQEVGLGSGVMSDHDSAWRAGRSGASPLQSNRSCFAFRGGARLSRPIEVAADLPWQRRQSSPSQGSVAATSDTCDILILS